MKGLHQYLCELGVVRGRIIALHCWSLCVCVSVCIVYRADMGIPSRDPGVGGSN